MALLEADVQPASVIAYCANPSPENIISQYGKRVIKISDHQVVKWGPDIAKEEAENPQIAYERVSRRIVRIPRVYAIFSDEAGLGLYCDGIYKWGDHRSIRGQVCHRKGCKCTRSFRSLTTQCPRSFVWRTMPWASFSRHRRSGLQ